MNHLKYKPNLFIFLDEIHILHREGYIINLNNLSLFYPKFNKIFKFQKKKIIFSELMVNKFYNLLIPSNNIIYLDNNPFNNSLDNLIIENNKNENNNIINIVPIEYVIVIYQYNFDNKLLKAYNNIKKITSNIVNIEFVLNLLINEYVIFKNYKWKLEIKKYILTDISNNYSLITDKYYISNDYTHVLNINTLEILDTFYNSKFFIYVKLKYNTTITCYKLEFYDNPLFYINLVNTKNNMIINHLYYNDFKENLDYYNILLDNDFDNDFYNYIINDYLYCGSPYLNN